MCEQGYYEKVAQDAFRGSGLTSLPTLEADMIDNFVEIDTNAFRDTAITNIDLAYYTGLKYLKQGAFRDIRGVVTSLTFPPSLVDIHDYAFMGTNLSGIGTLDLSNTTIVYIGEDAFKDTGLTGLILPLSCPNRPNGPLEINDYATFSRMIGNTGDDISPFQDCTMLTSIHLGPATDLSLIHI